MSSIAQIYSLEFKNLLKDKLSYFINNISDNLIQNIFFLITLNILNY